jgi:3-hydroxyacyl-CoA dehydrogenase
METDSFPCCLQGAGQMGTGIALVGAWRAGLDVKLVDAQPKQLDNSIKV